MYTKRKRNWEKHLDFIIIDILCMLAAFLIGYMERHGLGLGIVYRTMYVRLLWVAIVMNLCVTLFNESYKHVVKRGYLTELRTTISHCVAVDVLVLAYLFVLQQTEDYSRTTLILFFTLYPVLSWVCRCLRKHSIRSHLMNSTDIQQMLVITDSEHANQCVGSLIKNKFRDYRVVGVILKNIPKLDEVQPTALTSLSEMEEEVAATMEQEEPEGLNVCGIPVVAGYDQISEYLLNNVVDSVFVNTDLSQEENRHLTNELVESGVTVHINLIRMPHNLPNRMIEHMGDFMVVTSSMRIATTRQLFLKRAMDIAGGLVGLIITGIAALIFGPIIYAQSPGPIFFQQERVGKNGRTFQIYKFRSMYMDAEERKKELMAQNKMDGLMFKMDDDPRIIPIGKFIRKYSIDELPQFYNVIKGDMSLVGTRPPTVDEFEQYQLHHRGRLSSRPGITGLWQVSGRSDITDFEEVVELDTEYIADWSLSKDIRILWRTVLQVVRGAGAE